MNRLRMMWWVPTALLASALLIGTGVAPVALGQSATPAALGESATPAAVTAPAPAWTFTVHGMQDPYLGELANPREPVPGTRYVGFDVEVVNASDQPLTLTGNAIYLRDEQGFAYRSGAVTGSEPALQGRVLQQGERARGWVWFGVLAEAALSEILLVPSAPELRLELDAVPTIPGTPQPTVTPTPGVTPSPTATATPLATPAATPRSTASPAATPVATSVVITTEEETPEAVVTGAVEVTSTPAATAAATPAPGSIGPGSIVINGIADANLRAGPALDTAIVATLPLGTELTVTGPSVAGDDIIWWPVTVVTSGQVGFVAADLLTLLDEE